jgi:hypothetical protein
MEAIIVGVGGRNVTKRLQHPAPGRMKVCGRARAISRNIVSSNFQALPANTRFAYLRLSGEKFACEATRTSECNSWPMSPIKYAVRRHRCR